MKKIALLIPTHSGNSIRLIRGIYEYARPERPWTFRSEHFAVGEGVEKWRMVAEWKPDGALAYIPSEEYAEAAKGLGCPVVSTTVSHTDASIPNVGCDDEAVGRAAAEHFLEQGFRHFGFAEVSSHPLCARRMEGFVKRVEEAGHEVRLYHPSREGEPTVSQMLWGEQDRRLLEWFQGLPRPCAVFTWRDANCHLYCEVCVRAGIRVPEEVALLGVDNDELFCEMSRPTLSSVEVPWERIGYVSAETLDDLMEGREAKAMTQRVMPSGVVVRQSSDVVAVEDVALASALAYIRENHCRPLSVDEIAEHSALSRRSLEQRFSRIIGRTPLQEIQRVRMDRARRLLEQTERSIDQVGEAVGYGTAKQFRLVFREVTGETPTAYRARCRRR